MNLGTSFVHTFDTAGTYEYRCGVHAWMTGVVNVVAGTGTSYQSNGINFDSTTDELELNGTTISGFNNGIDLSDGGDMVTIHNNAYIAGVDAALLGADVDVHVHDSTLLTTSEDGNALDLASSGSVLLEDTDVQGDVGLMISDITGFRWNGGTSTANTTVMTVNGASGRVENMTWTDSDVHFDLGAASRVTSLGNTLHPDKMLFGTGAILYEGSLLSLDVDHLGNDGTDIGLAITSTDGSSAPYVSPSMQATSITIDGDTSDWIGNPLHPSDDAMPGRMSGQGTRDMYVTWDATNLYLGMTGTDLANGDMVVYFDIKENNGSTDGDTRGEAGKVAHGLPFPANYAFWAESGADSPNDGDATRTYASCEASASRDGPTHRVLGWTRISTRPSTTCPRSRSRGPASGTHSEKCASPPSSRRNRRAVSWPCIQPRRSTAGPSSRTSRSSCSSRPSSKAISRMERSRPSRSSTAPTSAKQRLRSSEGLRRDRQGGRR